MTFEILLAFLGGAAVVAILKREVTVQNPNPAAWLRAAARSGVTVKVSAVENSEGWDYSFFFEDNLDEIGKEIMPILDEGRKVEAIKLVRDRTGMGLREAKDYVEAL